MVEGHLSERRWEERPAQPGLLAAFRADSIVDPVLVQPACSDATPPADHS